MGKLASVLKAIEKKKIEAYHGTPHEVDKFSSSNIGTGEGQQAYGHGLYFAENPEVSKSYQTTGQLDSGEFYLGAKPLNPQNTHEKTALQVVRGESHYSQGRNPIDGAIKYLNNTG